MDQFATPKIFEAKPGPLKKRLFIVAGVGGIVAIVVAVVTQGKFDYTPHCFAGGITALIFSLRFYFMQVMHGPSALTFGPEGISVSDKASHKVVYWPDLLAVRYGIYGGHHWEIHSRVENAETLAYYVDGLSMRQQEALRETISSISIPNVRIVPFYDPLDTAA